MEIKMPELVLYRAHCSAGECGEFQYKYVKNEPWFEGTRRRAFKEINRTLDSGLGKIHYDKFDIVDSENEAQQAISALNTEFGRVDPMIHLSHCGDGALCFDRRVEFIGYRLDDRDELISQMLDMDFFKEREIARVQLERGFYDLTSMD